MSQPSPDPVPVSRSFARVHPALCLASGLFVSKAKAPRAASGAPVILATQIMGDLSYVFTGIAPLGSDDLRVMQAVHLLASQPANTLEIDTTTPRTPLAQTLVAALNPVISTGEPVSAKMLTGSVAALAEAGGYAQTAGGSREGVSGSLTRLAAIRVACLRDNQEVSVCQLLALADLDPEADGFGAPTDTLAIALAPSLSTPLLVSGGGRYVHLEQSDILTLGEDAEHGARTRLLHLRLCGYIDPGKTKAVSAATLAEYAFGQPASKDTLRRQLGDIRKSMPLLGRLGWTVTADTRRGGRQVFTLIRPALPIASRSKGK